MRLRNPGRPLTPEENIERNRRLILHPPKPSMWDRIMRLVSPVEEFWCRHVTQRDLYRNFDNLRVLMRDHPEVLPPLAALRAEALRKGQVPPDTD